MPKRRDWPTPCGQVMRNMVQHADHMRVCPECNQLKWKKADTKHISRCGIEFLRYQGLAEHHRTCPKCTEIKKHNIKVRMEKLNLENQAPERKAIFSETAKKTSARKEVQEARAAQLKRWRDNNPEKFAESIYKAQKAPKKSRMEMWLRNTLAWEPSYVCCGQDRKYVDLAHEKTWIEVDGCFHFWQIKRKRSRRSHNLQSVQNRDAMLKDEALRRGDIMLVRLSLSLFRRKTGEMLSEWFTTLQTMLQSPIPGVWCLGEYYELCPWANDNVTILKSPSQLTTSFFPTV